MQHTSKNNITSLDELISKINIIMPTDDMMTCYDLLDAYTGDCWKNFKFIDKNISQEYKKILVYKNDNFDIYVITWYPKQSSKFHDHSNNGCIFKVLEGSILEVRKYIDNNIKSHTMYNVNQVTYINNNEGIHKITNPTDNIAVTLHIYSPPNYICTTYDDL